MRYLLLLVLMLSTLLQAPSTNACSYSSYVFSGLDDYSVYDSYSLKYFEEEKTRIALVKTKKIKKLPPDDHKLLYAEDGHPNSLYKLHLEVVEVLKGSFSENETVIVPKMSNADKDELQKRLNRKTEFDFWDGFQLSAQNSTWYGSDTSCGPAFETVLQKTQFYVIVQRGINMVIAEPVSGPDDPFVQDIKNLIKRDSNSPLKIDVKKFFKNIDGYKVFDVTACPTEEEVSRETPLSYRYNHFSREYFENFDHIQGVVEETSSETKLKPQNFLYRQECQVGDRFLVLEREYSEFIRSDWRMMPLPVHRYAKISNGMINVDDIPTNYEITGEKTIPVEQVKTWIREGREAASKIEK